MLGAILSRISCLRVYPFNPYVACPPFYAQISAAEMTSLGDRSASRDSRVHVLPYSQQQFSNADETTLYGGPAWPLVEDLPVPKAVCGPTGSHKDTCLRTLAGGSYMGNMDTQRMGIGTTIYVECQVEGCGVGRGLGAFVGSCVGRGVGSSVFSTVGA